MNRSRTIANAVAREQGIREADDIYSGCVHHPAMAASRSFNRHLSTRALIQSELRLFLASMAIFNRHTIGGITILAGRLSDQILPLLPKTGHEIGAYVLNAAIDEYGLRDTVTHVELARDFAEHLGIPSADIESPQNACAAANELGDALFAWYRERPVPFALGVHTASEVTSVAEFASWHDAFLKFPQYRCSRELPQFEYMRAHYTHEPKHVGDARLCVGRYLDLLPQHAGSVRAGAQTYLSLYQRMFHQLDTRIFNSRQPG
ncbi:MAG TPA: iron-containing redox enzyme family protein [Steroidobacteraceae bacterium]|jgi:pyrroloquinoline quinone (PQQ) biosynthesis protein C|nr:iron-containing redox enzyme family protein [Steroidobacteraceae bacterium]